MKLPLSAALLASAVLLPSIARADDAARVETLKAFTRCDASFFSSLNTHRDAWQAYAPLKQEKDFTWIAVRDRTDPMATAVPVSAPTIAGYGRATKGCRVRTSHRKRDSNRRWRQIMSL